MKKYSYADPWRNVFDSTFDMIHYSIFNNYLVSLKCKKLFNYLIS